MNDRRKAAQQRWLAKPGKRQLANQASKAWRLANLDEHLASERERDKARRQGEDYLKKKREYASRWQKENKDKIRAAKLRRRVRLGDDVITSQELEQRLDSLGRICIYCGNPYQHLDHFIALARGGRHAITNLVPACERCNESKQDKEWLEWYSSQPFFSQQKVSFIVSVT